MRSRHEYTIYFTVSLVLLFFSIHDHQMKVKYAFTYVLHAQWIIIIRFEHL